MCACLRQLSAIGNHNLLRRRSALAPDGFDRLHDLHAFRHASKHAVLPVQPRRLRRAQEKLRPVRVRPCVGHGQNPWSRVLERKVFVLELVPVDGLPARSVLVRKIPSLAHEARNDAVKRRRFVPESGFPGAQLTEVFRRFRAHVRSELLSCRGGVDRFFIGSSVVVVVLVLVLFVEVVAKRERVGAHTTHARCKRIVATVYTKEKKKSDRENADRDFSLLRHRNPEVCPNTNQTRVSDRVPAILH